MEEQNLKSWEEFEETLKAIRKEDGRTNESFLLFRGQENAFWPLQTTLDRKRERMLFTDYYRIIDRIRKQVETLTTNEWPMPDYPDVFKRAQNYDFSMELSCGCPGYPFMTYLRHHGFPSPLLDWTRSAYIAAYFAFSKASNDSTNRVAIYVFDEVAFKPGGNLMPVVDIQGAYVKTHRRHVLQQSLYTLCTIYTDAFRFANYDTVFEKGRHQQGLCWKITLPATERTKVLRLLDEHNLNAFSLFESEESMMETLAVREFDFQDAPPTS